MFSKMATKVYTVAYDVNISVFIEDNTDTKKMSFFSLFPQKIKYL